VTIGILEGSSAANADLLIATEDAQISTDQLLAILVAFKLIKVGENY